MEESKKKERKKEKRLAVEGRQAVGVVVAAVSSAQL